MTALADIARRVAARTAAEQGLPERIEDPVAAAKIAVLLDQPADATAPHRERAA